MRSGARRCSAFADGKATTLSYDGAAAGKGYLSSFTDRSGTTSYERDAFGRVTAQEPAPGQWRPAARALRL